MVVANMEQTDQFGNQNRRLTYLINFCTMLQGKIKKTQIIHRFM
jgi:hypothetical protein